MKIFQNITLSDINHFFSVVVLTIFTTRFIIILFFIISEYLRPGAINRMYADSFHHYDIGVLLIVAGLLLKKHKKILYAIGLGIILEEHAVILCDFGLTEHGYHYLDPLGRDIFTALTVVGVSYLIFRLFKTHPRLAHQTKKTAKNG